MPNSYYINLLKWLDSTLKQFLPSQFKVKDTFDFDNKLHVSKLSVNDYFVSFDVESLFTKVPVGETINYICNFIPTSEIAVDKNTFKAIL